LRARLIARQGQQALAEEVLLAEKRLVRGRAVLAYELFAAEARGFLFRGQRVIGDAE
jgi:hypothetical protein